MRFRAGDALIRHLQAKGAPHDEIALAHGRLGPAVVMVTAKRGAYVAGAELSLRGSSPGATLRGVADGPICFFKLPPGDYRIEALLDGTRREARAVVKAGSKPARVVISFPDEGWDGIRAYEEEKRQARAP